MAPPAYSARVPAPLRVATYNLHAGVDGWGRRSDVVEAAAGLDADVTFVQESWRGDNGVDLAAEIAARTGGASTVHPLASGLRVTGGVGTDTWQPRSAPFVGNRGLFLDSLRPLSAGQHQRLEGASGIERGEWCVGIVSRLEILRHEIVDLSHLPRDRARRALVCATLAHESGPIVVFSLHGAHLSHGSLGQYRELVADLGERVDRELPAVLGGDLNCWGFIARRVLRGWRHAARGVTWPSWRPHSQLDHLFVRGPIEVVAGGACDLRGSDHRPVVATLEVRPGSVR